MTSGNTTKDDDCSRNHDIYADVIKYCNGDVYDEALWEVGRNDINIKYLRLL